MKKNELKTRNGLKPIRLQFASNSKQIQQYSGVYVEGKKLGKVKYKTKINNIFLLEYIIMVLRRVNELKQMRIQSVYFNFYHIQKKWIIYEGEHSDGLKFEFWSNYRIKYNKNNIKFDGDVYYQKGLKDGVWNEIKQVGQRRILHQIQLKYKSEISQQ